MANIILSYRKSDTKAIAGRVSDFLGNQFGEKQVVVGVSSLIQPGDDFIEAIESGVKNCQALVLLIGANWVGTDGWLNNASDHDHIALTAALAANKRVIPILVDGAQLPTDALTGDFASLTRKQPLLLNEDNFRVDMAQVSSAFQKFLGVGVTAPSVTAPSTPSPLPPPSSGPSYAPAPQTVSSPPSMSSFGGETTPRSPVPSYTYDSPATYGDKPKRDNPTMTSAGGATIESFNAINDVLQSSGWFLNAIIGMLVNLLPLLGQILFLGYCVRIAEHKMSGLPGLPPWNAWGQDFSRGFGLFVASVVYGFLFAVVQIIPLLGQLLLLLLSPVLMIAVIFYISTGSMGSMFDFNRIWAFISRDTGKSLLLAVDCLIFGIISTLLISIGFALFVIPGFFAGMLTSFGFFMLTGRWSKHVLSSSAN